MLQQMLHKNRSKWINNNVKTFSQFVEEKINEADGGWRDYLKGITGWAKGLRPGSWNFASSRNRQIYADLMQALGPEIGARIQAEADKILADFYKDDANYLQMAIRDAVLRDPEAKRILKL